MICWANIENFHAFAKCIVHRCLHDVGTLQRFLWLTKISETRIPTISKTHLSDKEIEKREIKPKPPHCRRLCCPPPLLPAAPSRRQTLSQSLLFPPPRRCRSPSPRATLGGVMARRKVSKLAQIIFNNQQRLVVALEGSGGVAQMGGDDDQ